MSDKSWKVKQGNTSIQDFLCYDRDGVALTTLAATTAIVFEVKTDKDKAAIIQKSKGAGCEVNNPSTGYVRVTLVPTDTEIAIGDYFMGLQLTWGADLVYDLVLKIDNVESELFQITKDVVT